MWLHSFYLNMAAGVMLSNVISVDFSGQILSLTSPLSF